MYNVHLVFDVYVHLQVPNKLRFLFHANNYRWRTSQSLQTLAAELPRYNTTS